MSSRESVRTFVAFHVLAYDGRPIIGEPIEKRRRVLHDVARGGEALRGRRGEMRGFGLPAR